MSISFWISLKSSLWLYILIRDILSGLLQKNILLVPIFSSLRRLSSIHSYINWLMLHNSSSFLSLIPKIFSGFLILWFAFGSYLLLFPYTSDCCVIVWVVFYNTSRLKFSSWIRSTNIGLPLLLMAINADILHFLVSPFFFFAPNFQNVHVLYSFSRKHQRIFPTPIIWVKCEFRTLW